MRERIVAVGISLPKRSVACSALQPSCEGMRMLIATILTLDFPRKGSVLVSRSIERRGQIQSPLCKVAGKSLRVTTL